MDHWAREQTLPSLYFFVPRRSHLKVASGISQLGHLTSTVRLLEVSFSSVHVDREMGVRVNLYEKCPLAGD